MMLLSRFWYAILAILAGVAVYGIFLAVGQYNRRSFVATNEALAADSQVMKWALQIDARRRLDAMLIASVDKGIQDALVSCIDKEKIPQKSKDDAKKALSAANDKIPAAYKSDIMFVVDRDGRMVAQVGFDRQLQPLAQADDFELGGYPAVYDALHGYFRDDTWVWGGTAYRVVARPVEYDVTQPPAGAVIGLKQIDKKFAQDLSILTRTNVAFYAAGARVASGANEGFDENQLEQITGELGKLDQDATYKEKGRSDVRSLGDGSFGAVFTKLDGEAYDLGAGFAVVRNRITLPGAGAFITQADDKDKASVSLPTIVGIILIGIIVGIALSVLEHDLPMKRLAKEARRLKGGEIDLFQLPAFSRGYRPIAEDINAGIERVAEKGAGAPRKTADLESILGPVPAQPAMSAFAFPGPDQSAAADIPAVPPAGAQPRPPLPGSHPSHPGPTPSHPSHPGPPPPLRQASASAPNAPPPPLRQSGPEAIPAPVIQQAPPALQQPLTSPTVVKPMMIPDEPKRPVAPPPPEAEEESTMVAQIPREIMAQAGGPNQANAETAEWPGVFEEFVRTKKQCNEPTEGLTFEKFSLTLKKNRDALVAKHNCKRVKFTVYIKDGRASLKATPVKD